MAGVAGTLMVPCLVVWAAAAAATDLRSRRIPNVLTFSGVAVALLLRAVQGPEALAAGLVAGGIGLLVGFGLYAAGGFGGGDGKLMMALGAFIGTGHLLGAFVLMGLCGGVLAVIEVVRRRAVLGTALSMYALVGGSSWRQPGGRTAGQALSVPYGVAIAAGAVGAVLLG